MRRPSCVRKSSDRAVPMMVPPRLQNAADRIPVHLADAVTAFDHALIAFVNGENLTPSFERGAHDGAHGGIHAGRITAAG